MAGVAAVVVLAGVVTAVVLTRQPDPEEVMRDFLSALQRRDVGEALEIAGVQNAPEGERARFLDASALAGDWQVVDVKEIEQRRPAKTYAVVEVTLPAAREADKNRTRNGKPVQVDEYVLTRDRDGDPWRIDRPFTEVRFPYSPLWYFDANGKKVPYESYDEHRPIPTYPFLPGVYRFYRTTSDLVKVTPQAITVLGSKRLHTVDVHRPEPTPTAKASAAAQQAANSYIDECARRSEQVRGNCPFGLSETDRWQLPGPDVKDIRDVSWKVLRYPTVTLATASPLSHFRLETDKRGLVQLSGTGVPFGNPNRIPFTTNCSFGAPNMVAGLTATGSLSVLPWRQRYGNKSDSYGYCNVTSERA